MIILNISYSTHATGRTLENHLSPLSPINHTFKNLFCISYEEEKNHWNHTLIAFHTSILYLYIVAMSFPPKMNYILNGTFHGRNGKSFVKLESTVTNHRFHIKKDWMEKMMLLCYENTAQLLHANI